MGKEARSGNVATMVCIMLSEALTRDQRPSRTTPTPNHGHVHPIPLRRRQDNERDRGWQEC